MRRDYSTGEMLFRLICLVVMSSVESFDWTAQPTNPTLAIKEQDVSLAWQYSLTADELVQSQTQFLIFWKKLNQSTSKYDLIGTKNFLQVIGVIGYVEPQTPRIVIDRSDQATLHIKDVRSEDEGTYKIEFTLKTDGSILAEQRVNLTVFGNFHSYDHCEASMLCFLVVSHNVHIADSSGDWNEKRCTVVAWCKQHGDLLIILKEPERKDRFEHRAKNQMAVFQLGARDGIKMT